MKCPRCGECPYPAGVCERVASRGRRFFLMGALALPVAVAIERIKPIVAPVTETTQYVYSAESIVVYAAYIDERFRKAIAAGAAQAAAWRGLRLAT